MPNPSRRPRDLPGQERWERDPQERAEVQRAASEAAMANAQRMSGGSPYYSTASRDWEALGYGTISPGAAGGNRITNRAAIPTRIVSAGSDWSRIGYIEPAPTLTTGNVQSEPLPSATKAPRKAIADAVHHALDVAAERQTFHTEIRLAAPRYELHHNMQGYRDAVEREVKSRAATAFRSDLIDRLTYTEYPESQGMTVVRADVIIMSRIDLARMREEITQEVIAQCLKQGYFR